MLVFLLIGDEVARLPQEWFLNTPVLWLGALVLIALVRGPLRNAPGLLKKPLRFAAASCAALGLMILVTWKPVLQLSKGNSGLTVLWFALMGLSTAGWIASFFWIFLARPRRRSGAAPVALAGQLSEQHQNLSKSFAMYQRNASAISAVWKRRRNKFAR